MTFAKSTHRNHSLVRRRPAERAGVGRHRSAQRRPGAGFLPLRLPVARRSSAGYRIYSASDFVAGLDCETLAAHPGRASEGSRGQLPTWFLRRLSLCVLAVACVTAVLTAVSTVWMRTGRAGGRRVWSGTAHDGAALPTAVFARAHRSAPRATALARRAPAFPRPASTHHPRRKSPRARSTSDASSRESRVSRPARALAAGGQIEPSSSRTRLPPEQRRLEFGFEK